MNQKKERLKSHDPDIFVEAYDTIKECIGSETIGTKKIDEIVDSIGLICQFLIWGDKNNDLFFDYFCDQHTITLLQTLNEKHQRREIQIQIMKSIAMFLFNLTKVTSINYVLSHASLTKMVAFNYNFQDDEIIAFYINMLRSITMRIDDQNIQLFFNLKYSTFPLMMNAIQFYNHKESMIRTSVRNIVLGLTKVQQVQFRSYIKNFPFVLFYVQFCSQMKDQFSIINQLVQNQTKKLESSNIIRLLLDDQIDTFFFLEDLLQTNPDAVDVISISILSYGLFPSIFKTFLPGELHESHSETLGLKLSFYLLIQIVKTFTLTCLVDPIILLLFGRFEKLTQLVQQQNSKNGLYSYSRTTAMTNVWQQEHKFMTSYSQHIFSSANQHIENHKLEHFTDLIEGTNQYLKQELTVEVENIYEVLGIQKQTMEETFTPNDDSLMSPQDLMVAFRERSTLLGEDMDLQSPQIKQTMMETILQSLQCNDDTLVYLTLMFLKTTRHSKFISHDVLAHCGLLTVEKNPTLYNQESNQNMRILMLGHLMRILKMGPQTFRLATYIVAAQLFLDYSKMDKDQYDIPAPLLDEFKQVFLSYIVIIQQYAQNPVYEINVVEFFLTDFKSQNSNPIQIWPSVDFKVLFPTSADGVPQVDNSESFLFKEPTEPSEKVRRDMMILMILKYLSLFVVGYTNLSPQEIDFIQCVNPLRPHQKFNYQPDREYNLGELDGQRKVFECQFTMSQQQQLCSVIEDEYNLVIIYPFETPEKCKILHSFNIKHIDEQIDRQDLQAVKVAVQSKNGSTFRFALNFNNKHICSEFKQMLEQQRSKLNKFEDITIKQYLSILLKIGE